MVHVYWVTIQLARDVYAGLANIRTTWRRDITRHFNTIHCLNEPSTRVYLHVVLYERGPATYTQQTQNVDSMVD